MGAGKRKGTVHPSNPLSPSPPPPRTSSSSSCQNPESVLKLLPVTILALALSLPTQDREVLAYLLARSILNPTSSNDHHQQINNKCKKRTSSSGNGGPSFGCGCFECYTSFWYRWDSSPNRELIHQVIEAFEEHLVASEMAKKNRGNPGGSNKGKRGGLRNLEKEVKVVVVSDDDEVIIFNEEVKVEMAVAVEEVGGGDMAVDLSGGGGRSNHKCLARKVLPDVVGLFSSRFWSLWSPGI